ncbi:MAG: DegT/DnrJ/EryC1/StrS family aminotransferase [Phycisphaerae bacterium]
MDTAVLASEKPAILGGPKAVTIPDGDLFDWPIVTAEDERAVVAVLRAGTMSGTAITREFEADWGRYTGLRYNLGHCNGTAALLSAMFGIGLKRGDEIICPSITYWASAMPAWLLGATPVFADIEPDSLCLDAGDIERWLSPRTRAIVVVHYCGHPADMDAIMAVARRHNLRIIEDCSHAHGTLYKGRMVGTFGDVAAWSMMAGKSLAIGEGGMMSTNDPIIHERAIAFAHYERAKTDITVPELTRVVAADGFATGLPLGALKGRMNQTCSAMGRVQLAHYPARMAEIQKAMTRFWSLLEGTPGLRPHRPPPAQGSTMGGWYNPLGHYLPEELGGLAVERFIEAVAAEGGRCGRGPNFPLHLHPVLREADVFGDGRPTRTAFASRDIRQPDGSLPVAEGLAERAMGIPLFRHDRPDAIARHAAAYRKVALHAAEIRQAR